MAKHRILTDLAAVEQHLSQLARSAGGFTVEEPKSTWTPAVDIYETPTDFVLTAEVPGVDSSKIDIKVVERNLILRGERTWERDVQGENFHRLESAYGKFERSFALSERIDAEHITAELQRGVLKVSLPKRSSQGKQIEVKTE